MTSTTAVSKGCLASAATLLAIAASVHGQESGSKAFTPSQEAAANAASTGSGAESGTDGSPASATGTTVPIWWPRDASGKPFEPPPGYPDLNLPTARSKADDGFTPGETPTSLNYELDQIRAPRRGILDLGPVEKPLDDLTAFLADVYDRIGLRFGFAYTMVFQQASGGPGDRTGTSGDIDFMTAWTLIGRETGDTGTFLFDGEYRFKVGDQPASALGGVLGTLTNTTGGFNDRGWVVRDAHWRQRLFDDHLRLLVGRADSSDYVGGTRLQSINFFFLNRAFSANAAVAFPNGHGPAAGATILPTDWFYVTGGAQNAYSQSNSMELSSLDEGDFFWFTEFGITPTIPNLGNARYRLLLWRMDERPLWNLPQDQGLSLILEQDFGDRLMGFVRYSYSEADLTNIRNAVQCGAGYSGLLGSPDDMTGLAVGYGQPPSGGGRDETVVEAFHRFQLTHRSQLMLGYQLIVNPANNPTQDTLGVFEARFRLSF